MAATNAVFPLDPDPRKLKGGSKEAGKAPFDPGEFYFKNARYMCSEKDGLAEIKVMRKDGMTRTSEKQVQVATEDGTALAGKNYQPTRTMITFPPGVETQVCTPGALRLPQSAPRRPNLPLAIYLSAKAGGGSSLALCRHVAYVS